MIALNELIENISEYENKYKYINADTKLKEIVDLEKERKQLQLNYEELKANTNKLCNKLAVQKKEKSHIRDTYNEIIYNEKVLKKQEKMLNKFTKQINTKLKKLPNLPDYIQIKNQVIHQNKKQTIITFSNIIKFIREQNTNIKEYELNTKNKNINTILKSFSNYIFEDNTIIMIKIGNEYILLMNSFTLEIIKEYISKNIIKNSIKTIQYSTIKINKSSTSEYKIKLNNRESIKLEYKKEYYTREYNIKYKDKLSDMTKFLNQINIKLINKIQ